MCWCEENRVDYLFSLARNQRLVEHIAIELAWAEHDAEDTGLSGISCAGHEDGKEGPIAWHDARNRLS